MTQKALLEVKGLRKAYDGTLVLNGVEFSISRGETASIIGPSGSGKTTLLRILCALESFDSGRIVFDGKVVQDGKSPLESRRKMSIVFQKPMAFNMSVFDNVAYGLRLRGMDEGVIRKKVAGILSFVGIPNGMHGKNALRLSGGELQRVALARSVVIDPLILFLDEPTANLDEENRKKIESLLLKINREKEITMIISTHNLAQSRIAKRKFEIKNRKLVEI